MIVLQLSSHQNICQAENAVPTFHDPIPETESPYDSLGTHAYFFLELFPFITPCSTLPVPFISLCGALQISLCVSLSLQVKHLSQELVHRTWKSSQVCPLGAVGPSIFPQTFVSSSLSFPTPFFPLLPLFSLSRLCCITGCF